MKPLSMAVMGIGLIALAAMGACRAESGDGLVTLRTPLGVDRAILTVTELIRVILVEDSDALDALFTRAALAVTQASACSSDAR